MNKSLLLLLLCFLVCQGPVFAQNADPYQILAKRCSSCHRWTLEQEAVDVLKTTLAKRMQSNDGHVRPLLAQAERPIIERFVGLSRPVVMKPTRKPKVKPRVVTPKKSAKVDEKRVFKLLGATCGRCHGWAMDANVVKNLKKRITPRIKMGHGTQSLARDKRLLLEKYYLTPRGSLR